ncbi:hypothetical protein TGDOM2_286525 [Toxoplasma gondii GAB2-2007-GAL-DOM2]|uniref:Uncharacterized protein n=8 Tax=Toxoplasma gondii TaxID=5811 RepID=A0A125YZ50_TOXGV|nr:hypothetical protein TGGT1_286525 [Toxoplasma gondii GT1]ESS30689.1 hypothetical protein TGVEG_286525 [Toxoplasma gondii VEG]KFG40138.1 hypothetical protein TGDOM2_286525 [Toxoplasma gondii GAB2-2007-GAL-DOM2]KFG44729.1 hypothetical protein TGP89_286525 [Toxoplasma gondii p89]KFG54820.1 hypothetical protein TGFOU_286525 [Toxoplasma gondii FOU]KFH08444.1 hypothetical protein TGVAND_286525 [Toxoplasma gondii VAND]PUA88098.1 hypothetical protein TGBR9_286525 [Toxoplasma gondii TgCATBr9]RQX69
MEMFFLKRSNQTSKRITYVIDQYSLQPVFMRRRVAFSRLRTTEIFHSASIYTKNGRKQGYGERPRSDNKIAWNLPSVHREGTVPPTKGSAQAHKTLHRRVPPWIHQRWTRYAENPLVALYYSSRILQKSRYRGLMRVKRVRW